ncbi:MAG: glycosyltransferase family 4 protein (plasmid) [Leptolyngbya sp. BL-A-14]
MKVLHLSTTDVEGGAARAAHRLHQGLRSAGIESQMLVRAKFGIDRDVIADNAPLTKLGPRLDSLPLRLYPHRALAMFSSQWAPDALVPTVAQLNPDVVLLHWVCNGFLNIDSLRQFNKPLIWLMHDMWAFTGGCHYTQECDRYTAQCGKCPHLQSSRDWDLSRWIWQRKAKAWRNLNLTIVSPSTWLAECAQASFLLKDVPVVVIPHGLDLERYKPRDRQFARNLLHLPLDKQLILFGASPGTTGDARKGFQYLAPALEKLAQMGWGQTIELVVFGGNPPDNPPNLGFKIHYLGQFQDDLSLSLVYSAADVMVVPSVQEAFGQTASEALACSTPVVGFKATGLKDIVNHATNGYLASPFDVTDLAQGIAWILEDPERHQHLKLAAREEAEREFSLRLQARRYLSLLTEISSKN